MAAEQSSPTKKVALVTGGGEGIGRATCFKLGEEGYAVGVLGRSPDNIKETAEQMKQRGHDAIALQADITDGEALQKAVDTLRQRWGRLDALFAHAGINGTWAPLIELEPEEWKKTIDINVTGTYLTVKHCLPLLQEQSGGAIVITASVNGTRMFTNTGASAYASSKAALVAFAKMAALELASHRIRVNAISPGAIESNVGDNTEVRDVELEKEPVEFPEGQIPLTDGKPGKAEDVAELVAFLMSDRARHITGTNVFIDGAQSLLMG